MLFYFTKKAPSGRYVLIVAQDFAHFKINESSENVRFIGTFQKGTKFRHSRESGNPFFSYRRVGISHF
jgi:FKBP-type peptidyl-prolyl cis-trans isomerase